MTAIVKNFNTFVNENELPPEDWNTHDQMSDMGMIDQPAAESFSIVNRKGEVILTGLSESFIDFVYELNRMVELHNDKRFTQAEQLKAKLAEDMEDLLT